MTLQYWYILPISIVVATVAMASGVGGATFFAPIFIIGLGLPPEVAIGIGLITEVFGFASGLFAYARKRLIDYGLALKLLVVTIPLALAGSWLAGYIEADYLKIVLGLGLFALALSFLRAPERKDVARMDDAIEEEYGGEHAETILTTANGEDIRYTVCNTGEGRLIAGTGGFFVGMISTGLGELNSYFLLQRCRVPSRVAVATSVLIVALTALSAATGHLFQFIQSGSEVMSLVLSIVIFTVPGVIIGGQLGPFVSGRVSQHALERALGILFLFVAAVTLAEVIL